MERLDGIPIRAKSAGHYTGGCWYCNVLNDASREENVRLGIHKYFEASILPARAHLVPFDVRFPILRRQGKKTVIRHVIVPDHIESDRIV